MRTVVKISTHVDGLVCSVMSVQNLDELFNRCINVWLVAFQGGKRVGVSYWPSKLAMCLLVADAHQSCLGRP